MMKKFYSFSFSLCLASAAIAGTIPGQFKLTAHSGDSAHPEVLLHQEAKSQMFKVATAPSRTDKLIENPQGIKQPCTFQGDGTIVAWGWPVSDHISGASDLVWDKNNGKVYIHAPLGGAPTAYIEGTLAEDGRTITVHLPQPVAMASENDSEGNPAEYPLYVSVMNRVELDDPDALDYAPEADAAINVLTYTITDDGKVIQTSPFLEAFEEDEYGFTIYPDTFLSCYVRAPKSLLNELEPGEEDSDVDYWQFFGNINQTFTPLPDNLLTYEIPSNLAWEDGWRLNDAEGAVSLCKAAIEGNTFYIGGLIAGCEDKAIVGTLSDGKVTFKNGQFLGYLEDYGNFCFLLGANVELIYNEYFDMYYTGYNINGEDIVFEWDADNKSLSFIGKDKGFILNSLTDAVSYYVAYKEPSFTFQSMEQLCAAPQKPEITGFDSNAGWGDPYIYVIFSNINTNGALISFDDMKFRLYINGELMTFDKERYGLEHSASEISCTTNNSSIMLNNGEGNIFLYDINPTSIGLQAIYSAPDGKEYASDIFTYALSGIGQIEAVTASDVKYFNAEGRAITKPKSGQFIIRIQTNTDGTTTVTKAIAH